MRKRQSKKWNKTRMNYDEDKRLYQDVVVSLGEDVIARLQTWPHWRDDPLRVELTLMHSKNSTVMHWGCGEQALLELGRLLDTLQFAQKILKSYQKGETPA
jgi:hypothetical protein